MREATPTNPAGAPTTVALPRLFDTRQVASYLGVTDMTVKTMRQQGRGPHYCKCGGRIWYRADEVLQWLDEITVTPPPERRHRTYVPKKIEEIKEKIAAECGLEEAPSPAMA